MRVAAFFLCSWLALGQQQFRLPESKLLTNRLSEAKTPPDANTLLLDNILQSVDKHYPPLRAALLERPIADADLLTSQGRFDLSLKARAETQRLGFYENERFEILIEQPLQTWGSTVYSGYSLSDGRYPDYEGKSDTNAAGQYRAGIRVPLARDRALDSRRADLQRSRIGLRLADLSIEQQRLTILQSATRRYWDWVAAGRRLAVARTIFDVAQGRDGVIRESVRIGALPQFEQLDNQRVVLLRQSAVVEARRALENAAIELSLFLRDASGQPQIASEDMLPQGFPDPNALELKEVMEDIEAAQLRRPDVLRFIFQRNQINIDRALARNQRLPNIDFFGEYVRELGDGVVKRGPNDLRAGFIFDLPFQRRQATGRLQAAESRLKQLDQREAFQRDQVNADVRDAASAVRAAFERSQVLHEELKATRQVEEAERVRYELGDSTLFVLNLREQGTAEAALREATALADYFRAYAAYELAIAKALLPNARPAFSGPANSQTP